MKKELLKVENITKQFILKQNLFTKNSSVIKVVDDISFQLFENEVVGLVGESGSGKSTVCRLILKLLNLDTGKIWLEGEEIQNLSFSKLKHLRKKIQMIFQDSSDSLNSRFTVKELIQEPLVIHKVGDNNYRNKKILELLELVGLPSSAANKYIHEFSGGQKQRIGIARALVLSPKIIIADEPVSALDVSIQAQILNLLKTIQAEFKISLLIISHDLNVIRFMSQRLMVMYLGKIIESGDCQIIFKNPQHPYTKTLLESILTVSTTKKNLEPIKGELPSFLAVPSGCYFHPRCQFSDQRCQQQYPPFESKRNKQKKGEQFAACWNSQQI